MCDSGFNPSSGADGVPFAFLNGLEISSQTGIIYFTDSSSRWGRRHVKLEVRRGKRCSRFLKFITHLKELKREREGEVSSRRSSQKIKIP